MCRTAGPRIILFYAMRNMSCYVRSVSRIKTFYALRVGLAFATDPTNSHASGFYCSSGTAHGTKEVLIKNGYASLFVCEATATGRERERERERGQFGTLLFSPLLICFSDKKRETFFFGKAKVESFFPFF